MPTRRPQDLPVSDYRPDCEEGIAALFGTVFGHPISADQLRWKYPRGGPVPSINKIAVDGLGRIVGHVGAIGLRGQHQGRPMPFYQMADVMVHPEARGGLGRGSLYTRLFRAALEDIQARHPQALAYGFPGERPFLLGEREGLYSRVRTAQEWVWQAEDHPAPGMRAVSLPWTSPIVDRIWMRVAPRLPLSLIRDRRYLDWRYRVNPLHRYDLIGLRRWAQFQGWAVLRRQGTECLIADIAVPPNRLEQALWAIARHTLAEGATHLRLWLPPAARHRPDLPLTNTSVVVMAATPTLPIPLGEVREQIFYTMGDLDIF